MSGINSSKDSEIQHCNGSGEISIRKDHIIEVRLNSGRYDKSNIEQIISGIKRLSKDESMLIMVVADKKSKITLDGIKKLFATDFSSGPLGKAYVKLNASHLILANLCKMFYNPVTPASPFNSATVNNVNVTTGVTTTLGVIAI